jgi:hypothetical protein
MPIRLIIPAIPSIANTIGLGIAKTIGLGSPLYPIVKKVTDTARPYVENFVDNQVDNLANWAKTPSYSYNPNQYYVNKKALFESPVIYKTPSYGGAFKNISPQLYDEIKKLGYTDYILPELIAREQIPLKPNYVNLDTSLPLEVLGLQQLPGFYATDTPQAQQPEA